MEIFESLGCFVRWSTDRETRHGVDEITITGLLTMAAFLRLRPVVLRWTTGAQSVLYRMDNACDVLALPPMACRGKYPAVVPPMAMVLNENQNYELWSAYAASLARYGIIRAVFLRSELDEAIDFARSAAGMGRRHLANRLDTADSDFGSL